jgi:hypothetical protein
VDIGGSKRPDHWSDASSAARKQQEMTAALEKLKALYKPRQRTDAVKARLDVLEAKITKLENERIMAGISALKSAATDPSLPEEAHEIARRGLAQIAAIAGKKAGKK